MPYVNIRVTKEKDGIPAEKKSKLIEGVTNLLQEVLGKDPQTTMVAIDELEAENWGLGGESITMRRNKR